MTNKIFMQEFLKNLVAIDTTAKPPRDNAPFGLELKKALFLCLDIGKSLGFETFNYDNFVGEIVLKGENENDEFAILCHIDTVPFGSLWTKNPLGEIEGDKFYGRGTVDDKGALSAVIFALKELKDKGFKPKKTIRVIIGLDEETGEKSIEEYKKVRSLPKVGISPDADFPAIYAEKGIYHFEFRYKVENDNILSLVGGSAINMVCDKVELIEKVVNEKRAIDLGLIVQEDKTISLGKSAHGSTPHLGKNALVPLLKYLGLNNIEEELFCDKLKLKSLCDKTGDTTLNVGNVKIENGEMVLGVDIRLPATITSEDLYDRLNKGSFKYKLISHKPPLYTDEHDPLIQSLEKAYEKVTGKREKAIAIGGGTYARTLEKGVATGAFFIESGTSPHMEDEFITFTDLNKLFNFFVIALKDICF